MKPKSVLSSESGKNISRITSGGEDDRAILIPMGEEHLGTTFRWLLDPVLRRQIDGIGVPTPESNKACWRERWNDKTREDYAILDLEGKHIGNAGLCDIDTRRRKAELWIYLGEKRHEGFGASTVKKLLSYGFETLKLNRISVRVLSNNSAALNFFRLLGFRDEGCRRQELV